MDALHHDIEHTALVLYLLSLRSLDPVLQVATQTPTESEAEKAGCPNSVSELI